MKTLDEVIKAYEVCHASVLSCEGCPYDNGERYRDSDCYIADALHYLMEYREKHDDILRMEEALGYCEISDNPPLTWDGLKGLVGKPVWVEGKTVKHWAVITGIYYDDLNEGYLLETYYAEKQGSNTSRRKRSTLGKTWQAYRKERK